MEESIKWARLYTDPVLLITYDGYINVKDGHNIDIHKFDSVVDALHSMIVTEQAEDWVLIGVSHEGDRREPMYVPKVLMRKKFNDTTKTN